MAIPDEDLKQAIDESFDDPRPSIPAATVKRNLRRLHRETVAKERKKAPPGNHTPL